MNILSFPETTYARALRKCLRVWVTKDVEGMTKILLVDDSRFLRMATERALLHAGYEVTTAGDGMKAIESAQKEQPDLILLDMLLPG